MKITYEGEDVLICEKEFNGEDAPVVIACSQKAEKMLYDWQIKYMNETGLEIGTLRTIFGLTFYAGNYEKYNVMRDFMQASGLTVSYGHL